MQEMTHKERSFQACNVCCEKQDQAGNAGRRERAEPSCGGAVLVKALAKRAPLTRALLIGRCRRASERLKKEEIIGDSGSTRCSNSSIYTKTIVPKIIKGSKRAITAKSFSKLPPRSFNRPHIDQELGKPALPRKGESRGVVFKNKYRYPETFPQKSLRGKRERSSLRGRSLMRPCARFASKNGIRFPSTENDTMLEKNLSQKVFDHLIDTQAPDEDRSRYSSGACEEALTHPARLPND